LNLHQSDPLLSSGILASAVPGLHIVANLATTSPDKLFSFEDFKHFADRLIEDFQLTKVGEVYYNFPNAGFTAVICLTESHLSIHTWPEANYLTFDVFLSNYLRDNRETTRQLYEQVKKFFDAEVSLEQIIDR
jgi:S-adenosylmethionine decarboxylase